MPKSSTPSFQDNDALLTYRVGPVLCCGPTMPVITITPPPDLTHLPGTNIAEPGIFKHGSYVVSATDLRYRFGVKQENWKNPGQVIVAQHNDLTRGYFVDEIIDVIHFPSTGWGQLPAQLPRGVFSRTLLLNNKIYLYAEFDKLSQLQGSGYLSDYISQLEKLDQTQPSLKETTTISSAVPKSKPITTTKITTGIQENNTSTISKESTKESIPNEVKKSNENNIPNQNAKKSSTKISDSSIISQTESNNLQDKTSNSNNIKSNKIKSAKPVAETRIVQKQIHSKSVDKKITNPSPIRRKEIPPVTNIDKKPQVSEKRLSTSESTIESQSKSTNNLNSKVTRSTKNLHDHSPIPLGKEDESSRSYMGSFTFLFIIIISIVGGYFFLTEKQKVTPTPILSKEINHESESPNDNKYLYSPTNKNSSSDTNLNVSKQYSANDILSNSTPGIDTTTKHQIADVDSESSTEPKTQPSTESSTIATESNTQYHASIKESNNTITIELDGPLPPQLNNSDTAKEDIDITLNGNSTSVSGEPQILIDKNEILSETLSNTSSVIDMVDIKENKSKSKTTLNTSMEIVHIIVKGDTLWAIAKRYLLNPFRYPELAKLSKIKNPDLIYPGNRVRIIYKNASK